MCSCNSLNGVPTCANLNLTATLRTRWGFQGYVTTDTDSITDMYGLHKWTDEDGAVVAGLTAQTDVESSGSSGTHYNDLIPKLVAAGKITKDMVDRAVRHTMSVRFKLGLFDPIEGQHYLNISVKVNPAL